MTRLDHFTPESFQDLIAALVLSECGGKAQKMGRGPDGGRDLVLRQDDSDIDWQGYTVFQVKYKVAPSARSTSDALWLIEQLKSEIDRWVDPRGSRVEIPDRLVFISNVTLTPAPNGGGFDRVARTPRDYLQLLRDRSSEGPTGDALRQRVDRLARAGWHFWDLTQVAGLLDKHPGVRAAFPALLTAGDVLATFAGVFDSVAPDAVGAALLAHARTTLVGEGFIYFDEAGSVDGAGYPLHQVIVDLPLTNGPNTLLAHVKSRAEHMLKPSTTSVEGPRHLVVTGAPGNGKTTISKFIVQAFRAACLRENGELSNDQSALVREVDRAFGRLGLEAPVHRRWPLRLDLALFAEKAVAEEDQNLLHWAASQVSKRSNRGRLSSSQLRSWMNAWPCLLVLDGLDEVTEPTIRKSVIERILELVNDAEADDSDLLVMVTTRPMGYTENIAPSHFERVDLEYLGLDEAIAYGENATRVRIGRDTERFERVVSRLKETAKDLQRSHLLRTPLQVLILTIILDGQGHLNPDRYGLFWSYYNTVLRRERGKPGPLGQLLRDHDDLVERLHEHIGLRLHVLCEQPASPNATVKEQELADLAWAIMESHGLDPGRKHAGVLEGIVKAATHRLVLLAPQGNEGGFGFDVRSLQEVMAARCITNSSDSDTESNLRLIAASPHWRNTWLFAAGRVFREPRASARDRLVSIVQTIDEGQPARLGGSVPVGPWLALDILDDGMCRNAPRWRDPVADVGLGALAASHNSLVSLTCKPLLSIAETSEDLAERLILGLRKASIGTSVQRQNVQRIRSHLLEQSVQRELGSVEQAICKIAPESFLSDSGRDFVSDIGAATASAVDDETPPEFWRAVEIATFARQRHVDEAERLELSAYITNAAIAGPLDRALSLVVADYPTLSAQLRSIVEEFQYRVPVGHRLATDLSEPGAATRIADSFG